MLRAPILLAVGLTLVACTDAQTGPVAAPVYPSQVRFGAGTPVLHVAIATTDRDRQQGLMGVRSLPPDSGMAFVWTEPTMSAFWMKDTLVPLSIAFVDDGGRIVTIREMEPCRAEPCPVYRSDAPFVMAIEANHRWFDRHGVEVGDPATLERTP